MKTSASAPRQTMALDRFLMLACIAAIAAFLIHQIDDSDIWWHLTIGHDILTRHAVPVTDHFSAAAFGRPYHDSQWLFQVIMALADRIAGMVGVQSMVILGWSAILWLCWRSIAYFASSPVNYLLLFLAAMASVERFNPRPEIITLLVIAAFWWMLQQRRYESTKGLLLFGLLQVIWTNSHGLFVIGPFMAGCYWFAALLQRKQHGEQQNFVQLSRLLGVLFMATLVMPYGWGGWRFAALLFTEIGPWSPELLGNVSELAPAFGIEGRSGVSFWFFAILLAATLLTIIPLVLRRQISIARLLILAGMLAAAMAARRNIPLFAIVAAPFVAENLQILFPQGLIKSLNIRATITTILSLAMLGLAWYPLSGDYYLRMGIISRFGLGVTPSFYPHDLRKILDYAGFKGQIYNSSSIGGFYLYHNYPERLPLIDGRFELHNTSTLEAIDKAPYSPEIWSWMVGTYDIKGLLLHHVSDEAASLLPALRSQDNWRLIYFDHSISLWMPRDTPRLPPAIHLATASLPPEPERAEDCFMLNMFLNGMGADRLKLQNLQRAVRFNWNMEVLLTEIGQTQVRLQQFDQANETFRMLLRGYPKNLDALNELGFLEERNGNLAEAESLLRRALEIAPDNPLLRDNYSRVKAALNRSAANQADTKRLSQ